MSSSRLKSYRSALLKLLFEKGSRLKTPISGVGSVFRGS